MGPGADFDGDGTDDFLVGAPFFAVIGAAHAFSGADGSTLFTFYGSSAPESFGGEVTALCDVSMDGVPDMLVGAPDFPQGLFSGQGYAAIYSGATGALVDQVIPPLFGYISFGGALARFKDVTGDGICDFAVAARGVNLGAGQIRVYSGVDRSLVTTLDGAYPGWLGDVMASGGDVDGDGVEDLIAGAPYAPPLVPNVGAAGRAIVYSGADWSVLFEFAPPAGELLEFGRGVDVVGDVNGDGFPDLAVGAAGAYNQPNCKVRVFSGAPIGVASDGLGCAGSSGSPPRIGATRSPKIGTTFKVNLSETPPGLPALLLLGFSDTQWWGVPLPLNLAPQGMPACSLLVSPDLVFGLTTAAFGPGNGRLVAPIAIPASSSLVGLAFYTQWYVVDPGPAPIPGAMTRGLAVTIQS
ncbi:MAG: integrin alpha [Planctomycetota bacterium]